MHRTLNICGYHAPRSSQLRSPRPHPDHHLTKRLPCHCPLRGFNFSCHLDYDNRLRSLLRLSPYWNHDEGDRQVLLQTRQREGDVEEEGGGRVLEGGDARRQGEGVRRRSRRLVEGAPRERPREWWRRMSRRLLSESSDTMEESQVGSALASEGRSAREVEWEQQQHASRVNKYGCGGGTTAGDGDEHKRHKSMQGMRARHVFPLGHPKGMFTMWNELADGMVLLTDFAIPPEATANIDHDVIVPYTTFFAPHDSDLNDITAEQLLKGRKKGGGDLSAAERRSLWDAGFAAWNQSRPITAFFRGALRPSGVSGKVEECEEDSGIVRVNGRVARVN